MAEKARIVLFTGDGKGKTTAALGMALRASGHGMRVYVAQFVKNDPRTGELMAAENLPGIKIVQMGLGFVPPCQDERFPEHQVAATKALRKVKAVIASGEYGLVVLDEVCFAVSCGLLEERHVLELLAELPLGVCIVLTGRGATKELVEAADTVTEMRNVKHALDIGGAAQQGVEL